MKTLKIVLFIIPFWATAQSEKTQFIHKGILSTYITISPSRMLEFKISNVYLHGNLEYYFDNKISVRGDAFYYVNSLNTAYTVFDFNHNLFFGPNYHFKTSNHFDPYISLQPGISFAKDNLVFGNTILTGAYPPPKNKAEFSTVISPTIGFNYFANRFFHLFMESRYIYGTYRAGETPLSLSELRFSFGLGFNLNTLKE